MKVCIDNTSYYTIYYPFFKIESHNNDFDIYTLRLPSGYIEEVPIFDVDNPKEELQKHLVFLLKEFAFEHDDNLTTKAKELKNDVKALFGII